MSPNKEALGKLSSAEATLTSTPFTAAQIKAAKVGAGISQLARHHGMSYGDAGRLVDEVRNAGARLADDVRCGFCGARSCGCREQYQAEQREYMRGP